MSELIQLQDRLRNVIHGTCNTIGCRDCGLKNSFDGKQGCAATDLQDRIMEIEFADIQPTTNGSRG